MNTDDGILRIAQTFIFIGGVSVAACVIYACGPDFSEAGLGTEINFESDRPEQQDATSVPPYSGTNSYAREAQQRFRTGLDVHRKIIWRTCTPNEGVCHNKKEYPDLHTAANFKAAINAPCNVQPGDYTSVYDRCEPTPDRFRLDRGDFEKKIDIGYVINVEGESEEYGDENRPTSDSPGLHMYLRDPVPFDRDQVYATGLFYRTFETNDAKIDELVYGQLRTRWWVVEENHLMAEVRNRQAEDVERLVSVGIREGDMNRNGEFGSDAGHTIEMIEPGNPEESYLVARMRGEIDGEKVPGSRMPLANTPLSISEMLALFCLIEGLPSEVDPNFDSAIDYNDCSYSEKPEELNLLGDGVTWERRVWKILQANCGGCHGGANPDEGLDLLSDDAYDTLLGPSGQNPEMNLIEPGEPESSYLWLKLVGDDAIEGAPMPVNPLTGEGSLTEAELGDIQTWIVNGAIEDE